MFFLSTETSYVVVFFFAILIWGLGDNLGKSISSAHRELSPTPSAHIKSQALQSLGEAEAGKS